MKLQNQSLKYLSISILLIISIWAPVFYFIIQDEIHDSLDTTLRNQKIQVIRQKLQETDPAEILQQQGNYYIEQIPEDLALSTLDQFKDSSIYLPASKETAPMRMLSTAFQAGDNYYSLKVWSSVVEEDDLIADLFWAMVWLYIVLIISIIAINNLALKRLWRPFYRFLEQLKAYKLEKNEPLPNIRTQTEEFKELKRAADTLTGHARDAFSSQKQFTENAAHELQTPLAVITNKIELLLENGDLDASSATELTQILGIIHHLKQLNKSLLLLSKIENKQFIETTRVGLNELCHEILENLEPYASFKSVQIHYQQTPSVVLEINKILIHILITNLIKNAIFHNKEAGKVNIELSEAHLTVANTGATEPLDPSTVFRRFYKGSTSQKSTGLGLSIAEAICKVYGFSLRYYFENEMHHFQVDFNLSEKSRQ